MQRPVLHYDRNHDILYIVIRDGEEDHFVEVAEDMIVEFDKDNQPIGVEIFNAHEIMAVAIGVTVWPYQFLDR